MDLKAGSVQYTPTYCTYNMLAYCYMGHIHKHLIDHDYTAIDIHDRITNSVCCTQWLRKDLPTICLPLTWVVTRPLCFGFTCVLNVMILLALWR